RSGCLAPGRSAFERWVKGPPVYVALEEVGVLVLPPQAARVGPEAVVGPLAGDQRQGALVAGLAFEGLAGPAFFHGGEEVHAILLFVGDNHVEMAVLIDIDEAEAG